MSRETIFTNAQLVLEDEVVHGSIVVRDGKIADISASNSAHGEDVNGDTIIPGLVELHTDHLESHFLPRPKVKWNPKAAVLAHDAQIAASGITTVLDALRIGADENADLGISEMGVLADAIATSRNNKKLRADHLLHLRCEVSAGDCLDGFAKFENNNLVKLVSLMDHAPGQRQFVSLEAYKIYYMGKKKMTVDEFKNFASKRIEDSKKHSASNREALVQLCDERKIMLASHDDATVDHVTEALDQGISVAEFPTTIEAAKASHEGGLSVLMGAPNLIRGGSHSGNVAAQTLAENGHLDILSSDYIPYSLVAAAFKLPELVDSITLPDAVKTVTSNPARSIGLHDRGVLDVGKRADFVRVDHQEETPIVRSVWREGMRVS